MTDLGCTVNTCLHHSDNLCCKQSIVVGGARAMDTQGTSCGSFSENAGGSFKNVFKTPESRLEVDCEAIQCVYNENRHCSADHIDIAGGGAKHSDHTECATFKAK